MNSPGLLWLAIAVLTVMMLWNPFAADTQPVQAERSSGPSHAEISQLQERIATLEVELNRELVERINLEQRLSRLESPAEDKKMDAMSSQTTPATQDEPAGRAPGNRGGQLAIPEPDAPAASLEQKMVSLGLPVETVMGIQNTLDRNRLEMLELRNEAIRDGWQDTPEFAEKMHELRDSNRGLREQFGDPVYDQYLYASGQPNRIVVREVYSGSAAESAGIQVGDIITGYASSRVFSMSDLRRATVEGNAGESVVVEIYREGSPLITSIIRGPMGISMNATSLSPENP